MRKTSACVFLASLLFSGMAMAKICKTVGPDGSVTYTDRPGVDTCENTDAAAAAAKTDAGAKKAVSPPPSTAAEPAPQADPVSPADIEKAVVAIMSLEESVLRSYDFCAQAQPSSIRRYGDATDGWRERNAAATTRMRRTLGRMFSGEQQRALGEGVKQRHVRQMAPVAQSAKDAQVKWCDQTMTQIESRGFDVKPELIAPLPKD